jgi:hypothetical protein
MTIVDDNLHENRYYKLKFVEFFEFLARVACLAKFTAQNIEPNSTTPVETTLYDLDQRQPQEAEESLELPEQKCQRALQTLFEFLEDYFE